MDIRDIREQLFCVAAQCLACKDEERPELRWLREQYRVFRQNKQIDRKVDADKEIYRQMYGKMPEKEQDLLKLRYWRTGRHYPVSHQICSDYGKALGLGEKESLFLLQGYYDSCDRIYEKDGKLDSTYWQRRRRIDNLVLEYLAKIPEERLVKMKVALNDVEHNLRHLYYTDALQYVFSGANVKGTHLEKHITSINYDSELTRTLRLQGGVPRKTMIRHLIILGMPDISLEWMNRQMRELGYLELSEEHTLRTGEKLDALIIFLLRWYDSLRESLSAEKRGRVFRKVLVELDRFLEGIGGNNLRFMSFKALKRY